MKIKCAGCPSPRQVPPLLQSTRSKSLTRLDIGQSHLENQFVFVMTQIFMTMQEQINNIAVMSQTS